MSAENRNHFFEKWCYKIKIEDDIRDHWELISSESFFLDIEFLENRFSIDFKSGLSLYKKEKNVILLSIFQNEQGIAITNCSTLSILNEIAYKEKASDDWHQLFLFDTHCVLPGENITILIDTYKIKIFDICERKKETDCNELKYSKNSDNVQKNNDDDSPKKPKTEKKTNFLSFHKRTSNFKETENISQNIKKNTSCFDFFGFDAAKNPEIYESPQKEENEKEIDKIQKSNDKKSNSALDSTVEREIQQILDSLTPQQTSIDKKKRRLTNFSDDHDELLKNMCFKKKRFKLDSPLLSSSSAKNKNNQNIPLGNGNQEEQKVIEKSELQCKKEEEVYKKMKRLRKIKDIQDQNTCAICLELIEGEKGYLSCKHFFCFTCIKDWSDVTNFCPLCKKEFFEIEQKMNDSSSFIKVQPKKQRPDHYDESDDFDETDELCYICDSSVNAYLLLVCDSCNYFCCHTYCLDPPLNHIPEGEWICTYCQMERNNSRSFSYNMENFFNSSRRNNNNNFNSNNQRNSRNNNRNFGNNNNNNRRGRNRTRGGNNNNNGRRRNNKSEENCEINFEKNIQDKDSDKENIKSDFSHYFKKRIGEENSQNKNNPFIEAFSKEKHNLLFQN